MGIMSIIRNSSKSVLKRYGYDLIESKNTYDWQLNPRFKPSHMKSDMPEEAIQYLQIDNPILQDLQARYDSFDRQVTTPLVWTDNLVTPEDVQYFRGDNPYVWQLRGHNMNIMAYALTTYYVKSIDNLKLLELLNEDNIFGNYTFEIDNKMISRDLLDSILEIYFLNRHIGLSESKNMTILDIGAGYGRLAHRMSTALPNIKEYLCTDGVAISSFISDFYLKFRRLEEKAKVIPLDQIENVLSQKPVDLAINIHSFSECSIEAIDWWVSLLEKSKVKYLMVVPNTCNHGGTLLKTNNDQDMGAIFEDHGYKLLAKEPKYRDPVVQQYAITPTYHYLFILNKHYHS